jgi:hypothetical protein
MTMGARIMKIWDNRPSASMAVAIIALVIAASGTAIAAGHLANGDKLIATHSLSGNRLRNHTVGGSQINLKTLGKVPAAANADNATTAAHATNADHATLADSATNATNAARATNADHATLADNATNAMHATNADHATSADSAPFVTTLPSHQTLRGVWDLLYAANATFTQSGDTFPFVLASAPSGDVIPSAGPNPDPAGCPGSASNPEAASGHLCVYVTGASNIDTPEICDPTKDICGGMPSRFGFFLQASPATATSSGHMVGTWAVTG